MVWLPPSGVLGEPAIEKHRRRRPVEEGGGLIGTQSPEDRFGGTGKVIEERDKLRLLASVSQCSHSVGASLRPMSVLRQGDQGV